MFEPACFVIPNFLSVYVYNHVDEEKRDGCFALTAFPMSCDSQWSASLPQGVVGWSAVCECGISSSYSLAI